MDARPRFGLLLTMTEPPAHMEEEFNAWYDEEHLPERLGIPGFRSARRWVAECAPGEGKYLATYELDSAAVLASPAYLERLHQPTPWSKRCLGACVVFRRWACEQQDPGAADPLDQAQALLLALGDAPDRSSLSGTLQSRQFLDPQGAPPWAALHELSSPLAPAPAGLRLYRAYVR
jgi:hypothetical protein